MTSSTHPPREVIQKLIQLINKNLLTSAVDKAKDLIKDYPNTFILWNILGVANNGLGQTLEASKAFKKVIELNPNFPEGFNNLAIILKEEGKLEKALELSKKALLLKPKSAIFHTNIGLIYQQQGNYDKAIQFYTKSFLLNPNYAEAYYNMGNSLQLKGKLSEAIEYFNKALVIKKDYAEAQMNLGVLFTMQSKHIDAINAYNKALLINPNYAEAYYNMGNSLRHQGKLSEAIESFKKALTIKTDYAEAYMNMGLVLKDQDKLEEAIESFKNALTIKEDFAEAYMNMGITLTEQNKIDKAIKNYNRALSIKPNYAEAYYNLSFSYNLRGDLHKGLKLYEWRLKKKKPLAMMPKENFEWDGKKSVLGKNFLVYEEQGLGDIIQFCRYLSLLKQKGARVIFRVKKEIHSLLKTLDSEITLVDSYPDHCKIDFETPLMSLPYLFKTNVNTIPSLNQYILANQDKVKEWKKCFNKSTFKIGICWQGSTIKSAIGRSFPLKLFNEISKLSNIELISLHKGEGERQIKDINFNLTTLGNNFDNGENAFVDTAAVMTICNLIITCDTAIAHLAGALGCPTWLVLKKIPHWVWMLDRNDSPWYPNTRLYRQKVPNNWEYVFDTMKKDLQILMA